MVKWHVMYFRDDASEILGNPSFIVSNLKTERGVRNRADRMLAFYNRNPYGSRAKGYKIERLVGW